MLPDSQHRFVVIRTAAPIIASTGSWFGGEECLKACEPFVPDVRGLCWRGVYQHRLIVIAAAGPLIAATATRSGLTEECLDARQ